MKVEKLHKMVTEFAQELATEEVEVQTSVVFNHRSEGPDVCHISVQVGSMANVQLENVTDSDDMADTVYRMVKSMVKNTRNRSNNAVESTETEENND